MNKFLLLPADTRRTIYEQVSLRLGIDDPKAIEKDIWVTGILQAVYTLPYADKLVFKGGSSLSKVWNLISRFSKDIDLAIDRSIFGLEGDLTKKQLKKLRKASSLFVKEVFAVDLQRIVNEKGLTDHCTITPDPDGEGDATYPEPRKVHIAYESVFGNTGPDYLQSEVLLEIGARSLFEPTAKAKVKSLVSENSSDRYYCCECGYHLVRTGKDLFGKVISASRVVYHQRLPQCKPQIAPSLRSDENDGRAVCAKSRQR